MKITNECWATCWCEFCKRKISKGERFLCLTKQAQKGYTRTNICRECLIKVFVELDIKPKEMKEIRKVVILESLGSEKNV